MQCILKFVLKVGKERWRPTFSFSLFSELFSKKGRMHLQHVTLQIPACIWQLSMIFKLKT